MGHKEILEQTLLILSSTDVDHTDRCGQTGFRSQHSQADQRMCGDGGIVNTFLFSSYRNFAVFVFRLVDLMTFR